MIRLRELYEEYKEELGEQAELGSVPDRDQLLNPLDKIMPSLYDVNSRLPELIRISKSTSLETLAETSESIKNAEIAANLLVKNDVQIISYRHAAANVVHLGDKLDTLIEEIISSNEQVFTNEIDELKKRGTVNTLDNIKESRKKISCIIKIYEEAKKIYVSRGLEAEKIRTIESKVRDYDNKKRTSSKIEEKIQKKVSYYRSFYKLPDSKSMLKELLRETKNGFITGALTGECKEAEYHEALIYLQKLHNEVKEVSRNKEYYFKLRLELDRDLSSMKKAEASVGNTDLKKLKEILDSIKPNKYNNCRLIMFGGAIDEYSEKSNSLKSLISGRMEKEELKLKKELSALREKEKKVSHHEKISKINENLKDLEKRFSEIGEINETRKINIEIEKNNKRIILAKDADYWNNKHPISDEIIYKARNGMTYDVRHFIQADDPIIKKIVKQNNLDKGSLENIAHKCMRWVQDNIKYTSDPQLSNHPEEWLLPTETLQLGKGDCEDGTNLMVSLMRNAGMPAYKIKNSCGSVTEGGHSWPIYLRETDNEWVILDWCYKASSSSIKGREPAKNKKDYREIWFTFNDEHSWAQDYIEINKSLLLKKNKNRTKYVSLGEELSELPYPNDTRLLKLTDTLSGNIPSDGWIQRMDLLEKASNSLINVKDIERTDYAMQVFEKLSDFYRNGYLGKLASFSEENKIKIESGMNSLYKFAKKVA